MQTLAAVAMTLLAAACADDYDDSALWDKVNDHEERIAALEKWQEQTNQSIAAMQELLNTTDMITGVSAVSEGGQTVGYTITFLHSDPITIYNGTPGADGEDGADGADGQTPQIGLAQAEDGNWYWTLNGETLTDADGNPIRANGLDGADGEDGEDGATGPEGPQGDDGTSAPTPQIKLGSNVTGTIMTDNGQTIADAWYLSVDGGATWYRVSGTDGTNGDTWFAEAPRKEGNYYVFTLTDQSTFRVAAYQPFRILTEAEKNGTDNFTNATVTINGATTFYLYIDNDIKYQEIVAQISSVDAVLTRADVSDWTVVKGTEQNTLTVTPGTQPYALLDVSLLLTDGSKLTASRLLEDPGYTVDGNTYIVASASGLLAWAEAARKDPTLNCILAADITLPAVPADQSNWTPIGTSISNAYTGTFDGGGKTITGLAVTGSDQYAGLFGRIGSGGTVKNVTLKDVKIESNHSSGYVGGVAGWSFGGNIENCSVSGSVSGSSGSDVGGVVGYQQVGSITGCSSSATVKGTERAGGVVGVTNGGATLTACYATGDVTLVSNGSDTYYAGGVVGTNGGGILTACYAWGSVTGSGSGTVYVGGVTGSNDLGTLTACYHAKGTVSGPGGATGGVAGRNYKGLMPYGGIITACYWGDNGQEQGIGEDQVGTGGITQVTGGLWQTAVDAMNAAIETWNTANPDKTCDWRYELGDEGLPVLTQQP